MNFRVSSYQGWFCVVMGIVMLGAWLVDGYNDMRFRADGAHTTAQVTGSGYVTAWNFSFRHPNHRVRRTQYVFTVSGRQYTGSGEDLGYEPQVDIEYLKSNPAVNRAPGFDSVLDKAFKPGVGFILLVSGLIVAKYGSSLRI